MAKQKLTRKSYKRNIIVFGLMFFMGIALVSTGFATWILSRDTSVKVENENVNVGIVSDNALEITNKKFSYSYLVKDSEGNYKYEVKTIDDKLDDQFAFSFEPFGGDVDGDVKWDEKNFSSTSINYEVLSLKISGNITPLSFIKGFNITMTVPEGIIDLAEAEYIVLPDFVKVKDDSTNTISFDAYQIVNSEGFTKGHEITSSNIKNEDGSYPTIFKLEANGDFEITFMFGWGKKFNYTNPSMYFDSTEYTGAPDGFENENLDRDYLYMKTCLQELRKQVHGCSYMQSSTSSDVEYEVYTRVNSDNETEYAIYENGNFYSAEVQDNKVSSVDYDSTIKDFAKQPVFNIYIDIEAN